MSRSLSQQVGILMIGRVFAYAVLFVVPMVNTRMLSVAHYGYYKQFHLLFETLSPLLILGFPISLQYYLPRASTEREKAAYVTQTLAFLTLGALIAIVGYSVLGRVLGEGMGDMVRSFYWRLCAFTGLMMISHYMEWLYAAEREMGRQSLYHVTFVLLQSGLVIFCSWYYQDVSAIVWGLTIAAAAKALYSVGYTVRRYRPRPGLISWRTMREQLSFALPIGLFSIALLMVAQTDKFIITRFLGREEFAIYTVGAFQVPLINIINQSVRNVVFPLMSQYHKEGRYPEIAELWRRTLLKTSVLYFPMFVGLVIVADAFIRTLYTDTYSRAVPIFMIYLLLLPRAAFDSVAMIQVFKRTRYLVVTFSCAFVANLGLSLLLFRFMGREGVPLATVITMWVVTDINLMYVSRLLGVKVRDMIDARGLAGRFALAIAPGVGLYWWAQRTDITGYASLAVLGMVYLVVYLGLCRMAGYLQVDDIRSLMGRRSR